MRTARGDCLVIRVSISVSGSGSSLFSSRVLARSTEEADSSPPRFFEDVAALPKAANEREEKKEREGMDAVATASSASSRTPVCRRKAILNGSHHFYDHPEVSAKTCPRISPRLSLPLCRLLWRRKWVRNMNRKFR